MGQVQDELRAAIWNDALRVRQWCVVFNQPIAFHEPGSKGVRFELSIVHVLADESCRTRVAGRSIIPKIRFCASCRGFHSPLFFAVALAAIPRHRERD